MLSYKGFGGYGQFCDGSIIHNRYVNLKYRMVKWTQSGKVNFFEKNLRIQFDVIFHSESNGEFLTHKHHLVVSYDDLKFCVGCRCRTNLKISNCRNSPPNGARKSKIPPFDSELKITTNCILRFFRKKSTFPLCFHFTNYVV